MADIARWNGTSGYPILKLNEASDLGAGTSKSAAFTVELSGGDYKTAIIFSGTSGKYVKFAKGNGIQGTGSELTVTLGSAYEHCVVLDSGFFKAVKTDVTAGLEKDCVTITPEAATVFKIVELPQ